MSSDGKQGNKDVKHMRNRTVKAKNFTRGKCRELMKSRDLCGFQGANLNCWNVVSKGAHVSHLCNTLQLR
jgi:hypothetical protein